MNKREVGEKIKELRIGKKETQSMLADVLGVSAMAISKYESGEMLPSDELKIAIAQHYDTTVGLIFFNER